MTDDPDFRELVGDDLRRRGARAAASASTSCWSPPARRPSCRRALAEPDLEPARATASTFLAAAPRRPRAARIAAARRRRGVPRRLRRRQRRKRAVRPSAVDASR